jgi:hypothetical protein
MEGAVMHSKSHLPSPALVVAVIALFVSLGGTAVAAGVVPLAKRALNADNSGKLQKKTVAQIAALPGPASTIAGLVAKKTGTASLAADEGKDVTVACDSGRVISGGFTTSGPVIAMDSYASGDNTWTMYLWNLDEQKGAEVTVHAICVR